MYWIWRKRSSVANKLNAQLPNHFWTYIIQMNDKAIHEYHNALVLYFLLLMANIFCVPGVLRNTSGRKWRSIMQRLDNAGKCNYYNYH